MLLSYEPQLSQSTCVTLIYVVSPACACTRVGGLRSASPGTVHVAEYAVNY